MTAQLFRNVRDGKEDTSHSCKPTEVGSHSSSFSHDADKPLQLLGDMVVHYFDAVQMKLALVGMPHHQRAKSPYLSYTLTILVRVESRVQIACRHQVCFRGRTPAEQRESRIP